jgi:hypothetical protein
MAGRQGVFRPVSRNPNEERNFQHISLDVSELAFSNSFVASRLSASDFGFCECNDTRNDTRRERSPESSCRNGLTSSVAAVARMPGVHEPGEGFSRRRNRLSHFTEITRRQRVSRRRIGWRSVMMPVRSSPATTPAPSSCNRPLRRRPARAPRLAGSPGNRHVGTMRPGVTRPRTDRPRKKTDTRRRFLDQEA